MKRFVLALIVFLFTMGAALASPKQAQAMPSNYAQLANYSPGVPLQWHLYEVNEDGAFLWGDADNRMMGYVVSIKLLRNNVNATRIIEMDISDFRVQCGPNGEPPDNVDVIGTVGIDPASAQYVWQHRNPGIYGQAMNLEPGTIVAKAVIEACKARGHA